MNNELNYRRVFHEILDNQSDEQSGGFLCFSSNFMNRVTNQISSGCMGLAID